MGGACGSEPQEDPEDVMTALFPSLSDYVNHDIRMPINATGYASGISAIDDTAHSTSFVSLNEEDAKALSEIIELFKGVTSKKGKIGMIRDMIWAQEEKDKETK
jgi:hypothetical protein